MFEQLCGVSAFAMHRIPPAILELYPQLPDPFSKAGRLQIRKNADAFGNLLPLHVLVDDRASRRTTSHVVPHVWSGELPQGAFVENEQDITLTSPLFTLLTMAPHISEVHLLMSMYELCGTFTVYRPAPEVQQELNRMKSHAPLVPRDSWQQVYDTAGRPTSLWNRPPLIEPGELQRFANQIDGMRGSKKFRQAAGEVTGVTASPLEVQTSIRLARPRRRGGESFPSFVNNKRIELTAQARQLAGQYTCYADIFFEQTDEHGALDVECQGRIVHKGETKGTLDANRTLALQSMGIDVALLTAEQVSNQARFEAAADHLAKKLGFKRAPKTPRMKKAETDLTAQLFIDWTTLGA